MGLKGWLGKARPLPFDCCIQSELELVAGESSHMCYGSLKPFSNIPFFAMCMHLYNFVPLIHVVCTTSYGCAM